ncbi:MAG: beta-lactamase family protein [Tannerellaceae bacterium]|jgi:CubicO group peptidase (beta-lactamase class C family)|nr:beta-lactamase family protein [Tannerellaceae bacterium]
MKKIGVSLLLALCLAAGYLMLPSNYFLRRIIVHTYPKIDQYPIFDNRVVEARSPRPWEKAEAYNTADVADSAMSAYGTAAFVVIKDGELLFESYGEEFSSISLTNSFSMAKSIVSLAIGCAIGDGFIEGVDQPVGDFFGDFGAFEGDTLRIRHLLTMSAGVDFDESYTSPFKATAKLYYGNDLGKLTFGMKQNARPGVNFIYQSGVTQLLAFIVEKTTGESLSRYVSRKLWTPMHAEENALWSLDREGGMEKAYCCFNTNGRDFARFGQLILNNGEWDGEQLVPADYLAEAISADSTLNDNEYPGANRRYGFQFWHLEYKGLSVPYMRGLYGQYVFAIPEKNAVIVRLGRQRGAIDYSRHYPSDIDLWLSTGLDIIEAADTSSKIIGAEGASSGIIDTEGAQW